ncbi:hypothetical protein B0H11DRAFT_897731 [Mycena galericulata]|nr:hypothetical protein B0H11DRAFT_928493 [Mycena galericulata]KAJ7430900.1 hypothetical protein B0H11DRAFT_897731 [Mycena galericulata]
MDGGARAGVDGLVGCIVVKVIEFVFSDTLLCDSPEIAMRVTFTDAVKLHSVTLARAVYEPSKSLSGGSAPSTSGIFVRVQELLEADEKLETAQTELAELERMQGKMQKARDEWKTRVKELDMKEHELKLVKEQMQGSNAAQLSAQVEKLKQTIAELEIGIQA